MTVIPYYASIPINPRFYLHLCRQDYSDPHSKYNFSKTQSSCYLASNLRLDSQEMPEGIS
jgi:hypothetical protein